MTNRLLINPTVGIRMSIPGVDVYTASALDLLLNPAMSGAALYASGDVAFADPVDAETGFRLVTVSFGTTFNNPPIVLYSAQTPNGTWVVANSCNWTLYGYQFFFCLARVYKDKVTFYGYKPGGENNMGTTNVRYLIFSGN